MDCTIFHAEFQQEVSFLKAARRTAAFICALIMLCLSAVPSFAGVYSPPEEPGAAGIYMVNEDTGLVIYEKNSDKRLFPASLTKIMTALVAIEKTPDPANTVCTMTQGLLSMIQGTGSVVLNLAPGEETTLLELLHAILIGSSGDAALVIADTVGGTVSEFVTMMNEKAAELGCTGTHFTNPHGLHNKNHYTTPADMYKIVSAARKIPLFNEIVAKTRYVMPATNKNGQRVLVNTNIMLDPSQGGSLYYKPMTGIKTGFTTPAGPCLVSAATKHGETYVLIVMKSEAALADGTPDRKGAFAVTKQLYEWAFSHFSLQTLLIGSTVVKSIPVSYGKGADEVGLVPSGEFVTMLPVNTDRSSLVLDYSIPLSAEAPIRKGDPMGSAKVYVGDECVGTIELAAVQSIERSETAYILAQIGKFFSSKWVIAAGCALVFLIAAYIALNIIVNRNKFTRRKKPAKRRGRSARPRRR